MSNELVIDLTKAVLREGGFSKTDIILLVTTGGLGYLAKEAFTYFFPGQPTVEQQLNSLAKLIEAAGKTNAKSLRVRVTTDAGKLFAPSESVTDAKELVRTRNTVDLEIRFGSRAGGSSSGRSARTAGKTTSGKRNRKQANAEAG